MPALIFLSPRLADQTFPRDPQELSQISRALGMIIDKVSNKICSLATTEVFSLLLEDFHWSENDSRRMQVYTALSQLLLLGEPFVVALNSGMHSGPLHPLPESCPDGDAPATMWRESLGAMLSLHDSVVKSKSYLIGVACDQAFAGGPLGKYSSGTVRAFPLVSPETCNCRDSKSPLKEAFGFTIPKNVSNPDSWVITFNDAYRNWDKLPRAVKRTKPNSSHIKIYFEGADRPWILDKNHDELDDRILRELCGMTGASLEVIKYVLKKGREPAWKCRLS